MPVDYTANWKKVEREVERVRGREGVREDRPFTEGGRDEAKGRDGERGRVGGKGEWGGRRKRGWEGVSEGITKGGRVW